MSEESDYVAPSQLRFRAINVSGRNLVITGSSLLPSPRAILDPEKVIIRFSALIRLANFLGFSSKRFPLHIHSVLALLWENFSAGSRPIKLVGSPQ